MQSPYLIGPTVYLRAVEKADARVMTPWYNDFEVLRFMGRSRPMSLAAEEAFLAEANANPMEPSLAIVVRETDQLIGGVGLFQTEARHRHAGLGVGIGDKSAWGKGYGSEAIRLLIGHAFETLNLNRVWLHVYEFNARAVRVYEKVGFKIEGRLRQDSFVEGRYWDTIVMGILREEWGRKDKG